MIEFLGYGIGAVIAVYLLVRVGSAAWYQSKLTYERMKNHEQRHPQG